MFCKTCLEDTSLCEKDSKFIKGGCTNFHVISISLTSFVLVHFAHFKEAIISLAWIIFNFKVLHFALITQQSLLNNFLLGQ
jgi:hypothetical protein